MTTVDPTVELLNEASARTAFLSSSRLTMLDHFRVPYELVPELGGPVEQLLPWRGGSALLWKRDLDGPVVHTTLLGVDGITPIPLFTRLLSDEMVEPVLHAHGGRWERAWRLMSPDGAPVASIWRAQDGSMFLPFDPNQVVESFWSERYLSTAAGERMLSLRRALMIAYYRVRPLLPRPVQIWLRRRFARLQGRCAFPRWPIEPCLHDFFDVMFAILAGIAEEPIPYIAPWPDGHTWALVLTHDVEHAEGLAAVDPVVVSDLADEGFEIGVHGIYHDGRDLRTWSSWQRRLPLAYEAAEEWNAVGFRSAALHRDHDWMRSLDFDYDSSSPDMDPFEPQNGGCCTWLPFFNGKLVELPLTLAQDHTLFVILDHPDETVWVAKAEFLRAHGGMAMIDTHPDYLVDERIFGAYARFLERFAGDPAAWRALPREVSAWWRRRAASRLEHDGSTWQIVGPAASEGRVVFAVGAW